MRRRRRGVRATTPRERAIGERPPHPRHRIVVRRDGDRADRGRTVRSGPTSWPRRSRSTRRPAGSSPRSRRARTCAGSCPSSTRPGPTPGRRWDDVEAVAVTYGPGLAGSLLVGINFAKALAWVHERPLVGVNHLEGHVYAAWLHDPGARRPARSGLPAGDPRGVGRPHVPRRDARPPVLPAARDDARRCGRARRSTRSGGCSGSAIRADRPSERAAAAATRHDRVFPRAWLGDSYDLSFSGLKTAARRIITEARADAGLAGARPTSRSPTTSSPSSPGASRTRWSTSSRRRPSGRPGRPGRARSCWAVASRRTGQLRARLAGEAEALGLPLIVPRPDLCTDNGAMIGAAGARRFAAGERSGLDLDARPSLPLARR